MTFERDLREACKVVNLSKKEHITLLGNYSFVVNDGNNLPYIPSKTGVEFHSSNELTRLLMGPYGSGKSVTSIAEIALRSVAMPVCIDGIRRSRWAVIRNTYGRIETTTLKTWKEWFSGLGTVKTKMSPSMSYCHDFYDKDGRIEMELLFLALDRPEDIEKLKSLELTGAFINELPESPQECLVHLKSRINRYPSERMCTKEYWHGLFCDANPPDVDHWIYDLFEIRKPEQHRIFHQPPAVFKTDDGYIVNKEADNLTHLNNGDGAVYYQEMILGQTEEFIKVYAMGQYGTVVEGRFVYTNYNDDLHSAETIDMFDDEEILLSWDFGVVCPACLLCQYVDGILYAIKEFIGSYMTVKELYTCSVLPFLSKYCDGLPLEAIGDPANTYNGIEQLEALGVPIEKAKSNNLEPRISAVRDFLNILVDGKPGFVISRAGCPKLRQGFNGKYNYKRLKVVGEERYKDVPDKTHPHSDIHDCLQYSSMHYKVFENSLLHDDEIYWDDDEGFDGKSKIGGY